MPLSRRCALTILGGGVIVAAGSGGGFLATRTPNRALAPWQDAGTGYTDPRLDALSWAILAPNPHNRQPWLVQLDGQDGVTLFADTDRKLPETDPFDRQITIGLGCFLEVARQAASARGLAVSTEIFPDGEPWPTLDGRPVARMTFQERAIDADPLFQHVAERRSCKEPYDMARPVSDAVAAQVAAVVREPVTVGTTTDPARVARISDLAWQAFQIETETPRTYKESLDLMRLGKSEIEANPDGIDLGGPFLESLRLIGVLNHETLADPGSEAYRQGLEMYRTLFETTPAYVWVSTESNTRADQLASGAAWVRLNLATTAGGLATQPVSQALQEYPEMTSLYQAMNQELADGSQTVQMLGRLGYGPEITPSPRWPLQSRVISG